VSEHERGRRGGGDRGKGRSRLPAEQGALDAAQSQTVES